MIVHGFCQDECHRIVPPNKTAVRRVIAATVISSISCEALQMPVTLGSSGFTPRLNTSLKLTSRSFAREREPSHSSSPTICFFSLVPPPMTVRYYSILFAMRSSVSHIARSPGIGTSSSNLISAILRDISRTFVRKAVIRLVSEDALQSVIAQFTFKSCSNRYQQSFNQVEKASFENPQPALSFTPTNDHVMQVQRVQRPLAPQDA